MSTSASLTESLRGLIAVTLVGLLSVAPVMAQDVVCPPGTRQKAPGVAQCVDTSTPDGNSRTNMAGWLLGIGGAVAVVALVLHFRDRGSSNPKPQVIPRPDHWPLPTDLNDLDGHAREAWMPRSAPGSAMSEPEREEPVFGVCAGSSDSDGSRRSFTEEGGCPR